MTTPVPQASPPSWLVLERYALGELSDARQAEVKAALEADEASRACLDRITSDRRPLPPLFLPSRDAQTASRRRSRRRRWAFALGPILVAATILIVLWPRGVEMTSLIAPKADHRIPSQLSVKGGEVAIALLRDRKGITQGNPTSFLPGDRFKVLVTSPPRSIQPEATTPKASTPKAPRPAEVVVFQGGKSYLPLPRISALPSGNGVGLEGAFSLDGSEAVEVCLVCSERGAIPSRDILRHLTKPHDLHATGVWIVCQHLRPESPRRP